MKSAFLVVLVLGGVAYAQSNLPLNPNADSGLEHWSVSEEAVIESFNGNQVFVVRNGGQYMQDTALTETDVGKYALLIGRGTSERVKRDGPITGLPYLYGYMMNPTGQGVNVIHQYLQGQQMLAKPPLPNEWDLMYGIYQVPGGTGRIRFLLEPSRETRCPA